MTTALRTRAWAIFLSTFARPGWRPCSATVACEGRAWNCSWPWAWTPKYSKGLIPYASEARPSGGTFDLPALKARFAELDEQSQDSSLWDDRERAGTILRERSAVESKIKSFEDLEAQVADLDVYSEMAS